MINLQDSGVAERLRSVFPEEARREDEQAELSYFYVIKATVLKPQIEYWNQAADIFDSEGSQEMSEEQAVEVVKNKIDEELNHFNRRTPKERKLELVDISSSEPSLLFLLSCKDEQEKAGVVNKFGAFARSLWSSQEFSKLVLPSSSRQNRLFTLKIKQVDESLNVLRVIAE